MTVSNLTTAMLLKMEAAGGLLTDPSVTGPVTESLYDWLYKFPQVDTQLVIRWYDLHKAKVAMRAEIDRLTSS
jgi:hypothetical protein